MALAKISPDTWRKLTDNWQNELDRMYELRLMDMQNKYRDGWSKAHIATYWHITRQRVDALLRQAGDK